MREHRDVVERPRLLDEQEQRERKRRVAERVDDERLLRRCDRRRPLVLEPDQEIRGEPDEAPGCEQNQEVAALDEQQHREDEERHVREEAALLVDCVHVADRVGDDQRADAGDDQHHEHRELVDVQREPEVEVPGRQPAPCRRRLPPEGDGAGKHLEEDDESCDERPCDGHRRDQRGRAARNGRSEQRDQRTRWRAAGEGRSRQRRSFAHPWSEVSRSVSSASWRLAMATISPRPMTTSEAATAITASAKI